MQSNNGGMPGGSMNATSMQDMQRLQLQMAQYQQQQQQQQRQAPVGNQLLLNNHNSVSNLNMQQQFPSNTNNAPTASFVNLSTQSGAAGRMSNPALAMMQQQQQGVVTGSNGASLMNSGGPNAASMFSWNGMQQPQQGQNASSMDASTGSSARLMAMANMNRMSIGGGAGTISGQGNSMNPSTSTMPNMQTLLQQQQVNASHTPNQMGFQQQHHLSGSQMGSSTNTNHTNGGGAQQLMLQQQIASLQKQMQFQHQGGIGTVSAMQNPSISNATVGSAGPRAANSLQSHQQQLLQQIQQQQHVGPGPPSMPAQHQQPYQQHQMSAGMQSLHQQDSTPQNMMNMLQQQPQSHARNNAMANVMSDQSSQTLSRSGSLNEQQLRIHQQNLLRASSGQQTTVSDTQEAAKSVRSQQQSPSQPSKQHGMHPQNATSYQPSNNIVQGPFGGMHGLPNQHSMQSVSNQQLNNHGKAMPMHSDGSTTLGMSSHGNNSMYSGQMSGSNASQQQGSDDPISISQHSNLSAGQLSRTHQASSNDSGQKTFLDGSFAGGWQSNDDLPDRRRVIFSILEVIRQIRPDDTSKMSNKLPHMAKSLEEHLYRSAHTKDEYLDFSTLKERLQAIAHGLDLHRGSSSPMVSKNHDTTHLPQQSSNPSYPNIESQQNPLQIGFPPSLTASGPTSQQHQNAGWTGPYDLSSKDVMKIQGQINADNLVVQRNAASQQSFGRIAGSNSQHGGIMSGSNIAGPNHNSGIWPTNMGSSESLGQPSIGNVAMNGGSQHQSSMNQGMNDMASMSQTSQQNDFAGSSLFIDPLQGFNWQSGFLSDSNMPPPVGNGIVNSEYPNTPKYQDPGVAQKQKVILQQQQRLLLLRHASKCKARSNCTTKFCSQMVTLWKHMKTCRDKNCKTSHCLSSRCVLNHYRICKNQGKTSTCEVCGPVMAKIRQQERDDGTGDPLATDSSAMNFLQPSLNALPNVIPTKQIGGLSQVRQSDNILENSCQSEQVQLQQLQAQQMKLQTQLDSLKQLQKQQEQLLEQQSRIQEQAHKVKDPSSQQAQQLQQQQLLLHQLQKRCEQQQLQLQQEIQSQSRTAGLAQAQAQQFQAAAQFRTSVQEAQVLQSSSPIIPGSYVEPTESKKKRHTVTKSKRISSKGKRGGKGKGLRAAVEVLSSHDPAEDNFDPYASPKKRGLSSSSKPAQKKRKATSDKEADPGERATGTDIVEDSTLAYEGNTSLLPFMSLVSVRKHVDSLNKKTSLWSRMVTYKCLPVIQELIDDQFGWVFHDAVDPIALGLPDYFDVVKHPMHLELVKKKLENAIYCDTDSFAHDVELVFENAILYNGETSEVGELANSFLVKFAQIYEKLIAGIESPQQLVKKNGEACALCGLQKRQLEPLSLYCHGNCGMQPIERHSSYFTDHSKSNLWCLLCYDQLHEEQIIFLDDGSDIRKKDLQEFKNDTCPEEAWITCDECNSQVHEVCALFSRRNKAKASYTCPNCYTSKSLASQSTKSVAKFVKGADYLPHCKMSIDIEKGLHRTLQDLYDAKAKDEKLGAGQTEQAEGLTVRVLSNVEKKQSVGARMQRCFSEKGYPLEFPVRSKCIALFQKIHGVDTLLFSVYVYEYGQECPAPNKRRVYISCLDSVQYFEPSCYRKAAYQAIIVEYLRYVKERGFHTAHIWSCPLTPEDGYIFYCHPSHQLIPREDMLQAWYHQLLEKAKSSGVAISTTTLYHEYFEEGGADSTKTEQQRLPTCLPYFEGDYIPGEIENILETIDEKENQSSVQKLIMSLLGQRIMKMKDNFLVVHLHNDGVAAACEQSEDVSKGCDGCDEKIVLSKRSSTTEPGLMRIDVRDDDVAMTEADAFPVREDPTVLKTAAPPKKVNTPEKATRSMGEATSKSEKTEDKSVPTPGMLLFEKPGSDTSLVDSAKDAANEGVAPISVSMGEPTAESEKRKDRYVSTAIVCEKPRSNFSLIESTKDTAETAAAPDSISIVDSKVDSKDTAYSTTGALLCGKPGSDISPIDSADNVKNEIELPGVRVAGVKEESGSEGLREKVSLAHTGTSNDIHLLSRGATDADVSRDNAHVGANAVCVVELKANDEPPLEESGGNGGLTNESDGVAASLIEKQATIQIAGGNLSETQTEPIDSEDGCIDDSVNTAVQSGELDEKEGSATEQNRDEVIATIDKKASKRLMNSAISTHTEPNESSSEISTESALATTSPLVNRRRPLNSVESNTWDEDAPIENALFETPQHFLNFCKSKHFQFDELRRAKHSTLSILFQLHNPMASHVLQQCGSCYRDITCDSRYHCNVCSNFDLCQECYSSVMKKEFVLNDSRFAHDTSHTFSPIDTEMLEETKTREERQKSLTAHVELLEHAVPCQGPPACSLENCLRMKKLVEHVGTCMIQPKKDCKICSRLLSLCTIHSRLCAIRGPCPIPFCDRIRERNKRLRQQQDLVDDRRRQAQNELYQSSEEPSITT